MVDVTSGNRTNLVDASDCGGRLGPYLEEGAPDLRNLAAHAHPCAAGDIVFLVSDGVHDNIDPQSLGKSPRHFGLAADTWQEAERLDSQATASVKDQFRVKFIRRLIGEHKDPRAMCPAITKKLIDYCKQITRRSRLWMEQNPSKKLPEDYTNFPGKLDHTTCLAFVVGEVVGQEGSYNIKLDDAPQFDKPLPTAP